MGIDESGMQKIFYGRRSRDRNLKVRKTLKWPNHQINFINLLIAFIRLNVET